jgi:plastocyanin
MNFAFSPATLTVKTGTKVTWTNSDSVTHTVTADQGTFDSGGLSPGSSFSFTFTKTGTYSYHCNIHHSMTATVIVQ